MLSTRTAGPRGNCKGQDKLCRYTNRVCENKDARKSNVDLAFENWKKQTDCVFISTNELALQFSAGSAVAIKRRMVRLPHSVVIFCHVSYGGLTRGLQASHHSSRRSRFIQYCFPRWLGGTLSS